jgi:RNA polymerase sigma-70 factor (ECF subfamily)
MMHVTEREATQTIDVSDACLMVDHLFRSRAGQMVAYLTRLLGPEHLDLAEEVTQEALLKALQHWPYSGIPQNPAGWLFRVARNAALDAVRHRTLAGEKSTELAVEHFRNADASSANDELEDQLRDDELRMVLMCCHPTLPQDARVALSLKTVGGFSVREIARAFLADEATIAQRLVRAKRQIRESRIRFELPAGEELVARMDSALEVVYLMFNEGYAAQSGEDLVRQDLCGEALRLGRLLATSSVGTPQAHALVALMAFQAARLPARVDAAGELVLLENQDRGEWDARLIALGFDHFTQCAEGTELTSYHVQAAIAATHARAQEGRATDWKLILELYDQLIELSPSPVVELNRAVVVAKVHGPEAALAALRPLEGNRSLRNYYLLPAVQGQLLLEIGDKPGASESFRQALERPCSEPEQRFLQRKLAECSRM